MRRTLFEKTRSGIAQGAQQPSGRSVIDLKKHFPNQPLRVQTLALPALSEIDVVRHYTQLSQDNHGVDNGAYPLGSCTMKYNPKRNDVAANLPGFAHAHPEQPEHTLGGLWQMLHHLQAHMAEITGMDAVSLQPAAGANGELAGLFIIRQYLKDNGQGKRHVILVADSAHGTNLASAAMVGFTCKTIATTDEGLMDLDALQAALNDDVAALMLTNPSTLGLFEKNILTIAKMVHESGALLYYDGANLNALIGIVKPGDMGFDVVHVNTHKTFSTPHSGGGPGAGPVGVKAFLQDYLPTPIAHKIPKKSASQSGDQYGPLQPAKTIGQMKTYYGHIDVLVRAYAYILTIGKTHLHQIAEEAVLNANYIQARLKALLPPVYPHYCMHECLLSADAMPLSAYDLAKRLIDYELHPPTLLGAGCVYFPGTLKSAMLIEPTETESKESLDRLIFVFQKVIQEAGENEELVRSAPHTTRVSKIIPSNIKSAADTAA
jgi:glycine dehydrogenase subunit 2